MTTLSQHILTTMYAFAVLLAAGLATPSTGFTAPLSATLDRHTMAADETVTLTIETTRTDSANQPDLEPLRAEFDVLGVSQSSRIQIINGKTDTTKSWIVNLAPKQQGTLTIPRLRVGHDQTEELTLKVEPPGYTPGNNNSTGDRDDVFLEMTADIHDPYVQQQVIVTQRLYYSVQLRDGSLSKLESDGALIERLGDDKEYEKDIKGQRYRVIERRYAVFPQKSGPLMLAGAQLSAQIPERRSNNSSLNRFFGRDMFDDPFGLLQSLRPISRRSQNITLDVQPQPTATTGPWLPARQLRIEEEWTPDSQNLTTGQPVTRTVRVIAGGLASNQLPPLPVPELAFAKVYPDQTSSRHVAQADGLTATVEQKLAVIPQAGGDFILPELRLPWWNVIKKQQEFAYLPPRKIHVKGDVATPANTSPAPQTATDASNVNVPTFEPLTTHVETNSADTSPWKMMTAGFSLAWIATLILWLRERRRHGNELSRIAADHTTQVNDASTRTALGHLKEACHNNDARAAAHALLAWAKAAWTHQPPRSLPALAERLTSAEARQVILALDRSLYSGSSSNWNGKNALSILTSGLKVTVTHTANENDLPLLYPVDSRRG